MTLPSEARLAQYRAYLLAMICQRRESGVPEPIRELAARAFRHAPGQTEIAIDPEEYNLFTIERMAWLNQCLGWEEP